MNEKNNETRNERKTLPFSWEYGQEEITLKVSSYAYGNGLAILMYRQEEGAVSYTHLEEYAAMKKQQREEVWAEVDAQAQAVFQNGDSLKGCLLYTSRCV